MEDDCTMKQRKGSLSIKDKVVFGNKTIHYSIVRSARRKKTIALFIEPAGNVLIRAPMKTSSSRLTRIVKSKAEWIIRKQKAVDDVLVLTKKEFVSGESFSYLGRHVRLKVLRSHKVNGPVVKMTRGRMQVVSNASSKNKRSAQETRAALIEWYKKQAVKRIPERVRIYIKKMGLPEPRVIIRDQKKIWGSCSTDSTLRFNWRIIMAPMSLVDYVVVHELSHLKHRNHSKSFWKYLGMSIPDYEKRKERLRRLGRGYQF